jgi:hypothetical protein
MAAADPYCRLACALLLAAALLLAMAALQGCRTRTSWRAEYHATGELAAVQYGEDTGWSFWSEGDSKVVDILDINLSGASLK